MHWISASFCQREDCVFVFVRMIACSANKAAGEERYKEPAACCRSDLSPYEHGEDKR